MFLLEYIKKDINIPKIFNKNDIDVNLWYATGKHDTGLHYDDYNGIITVLKGYKNIILYPPKDSFFLSPYCILPYWTKTKAIKFYYNTYEYIKEIHNALPSSRLLYELIMCYENKKMLYIITNIINKIGINKIIYGCKLQDNIFRCELYFYHYDSINNNKLSDYNLRNYNNINQNNNIIIHSLDLYNKDNDNEILGNEIHFYYNTENILKLPHFGYGNKKIDNNIIDETLYFVDFAENVQKNYQTYLKKIKLEKFLNFECLLYKYKCKMICIHNKYNNQLFIQYLDISINDFINFLIKFNYPKKFIQYVKKNKQKYKEIIHEITIVYDEQLIPIRTAFYGLI
jgi:hypothetical protein